MKHIDIALKEYGVKEIVGSAHNARIIKYSTDIGNTWVTTDEVAWCSEFVNWCLLQAGIEGTRSAVARSFLTWGTELQEPEFGCLVIFSRTEDDQASGHISFFIAEDGNYLYCLGGNQSNMVNITKYPKSKVLSYRAVPTEPTSPRDMRLGMRGEDVRQFQLLFPNSLVADGIFGPKTEKVVKNIQVSFMLSPTGVVDSVLRRRLGL